MSTRISLMYVEREGRPTIHLWRDMLDDSYWLSLDDDGPEEPISVTEYIRKIKDDFTWVDSI